MGAETMKRSRLLKVGVALGVISGLTALIVVIYKNLVDELDNAFTNIKEYEQII